MNFLVVSLILASLTTRSVCYSSVSASSLKVYYVKPRPTSAKCHSSERPCHTLQYYADHSNFTSNSEFRFLKGEHHLDSVVKVNGITNLSLIGAGSGVKILCQSLPSGFHIVKFAKIKFENFSMSGCSGSSAKVAIQLDNGFKASVSHVNISSSRGGGVRYADTGLSCMKSNSFLFRHNFISTYSIGLDINCTSNNFETKNCSVGICLPNKLTQSTGDSKISVSDTVFVGSGVSARLPHNQQECSNHFMEFTRITITKITIAKPFLVLHLTDCGVLIKDSIFSDSNITENALNIRSSHKDRGNVSLLNVIVKNMTSPSLGLVLDSVYATISNCTFENNLGTALQINDGIVTFQGTNVFRHNRAARGAAIQIHNGSLLHLSHNATVYFLNNHAYKAGGAIYVDDPFHHFCQVDYFPTDGIKLNLSGNTARHAGSDLFGGGRRCCDRKRQNCSKLGDVFNISNTETNPSAIASYFPYRVCLCEHKRHQPNCSLLPHVISTIPGGIFTLRLAIIDKIDGGVVAAEIHAFFNYFTTAKLGALQSIQVSKPRCSDFKFSILSKNKNEKLILSINDRDDYLYYSKRYSQKKLKIQVHLNECPLGFVLSNTSNKCVCAPIISRENVECFIQDKKISRQGNIWIGFINSSLSHHNNNMDVLLNDNCPSGYCLARPVNVTVNSSDDQCGSHRTGILCGQCKEGYSLTLSTQQCRKCSNTYLLLIFPLAFLGILLVVLLFVLNLTVSEGTINGLIFYANVVEMNYILRLPKKQNYLYIFLAWLNLDLGISTCLFDGMDAYTETWLQFVFPFYLWMIILLIIFFYNKFPTIAARLGGRNAVNVLATLLLLSYTKLQQTVVTILSFTSLKYPSSGTVHYVWLYDANVDYFKGKHLYLSITAITVLIFLIIPYTFCLAFFQHLQAHSQRRILHWVNKLKPVFDAYAGPYKDSFRFWTGMLLIIRTLLIVIFTINISGSIDLNLLVVQVVSVSLLLASSSGIYRKWFYNYLESFFYLQLVVFAGGLAYAKDHGNVTAVIDASAGISLVLAIAVMIYHLVRCIAATRYAYHLQDYAILGGREEEDSLLDYNRATS